MKKIKKAESGLFASEEEVNACIGDLAEAFVEELKEQKLEDLEPFEFYAAKVKTDFFLKSKDFKTRFVNGYKVLGEQYKKDQNDTQSTQ